MRYLLSAGITLAALIITASVFLYFLQHPPEEAPPSNENKTLDVSEVPTPKQELPTTSETVAPVVTPMGTPTTVSTTATLKVDSVPLASPPESPPVSVSPALMQPPPETAQAFYDDLLTQSPAVLLEQWQQAIFVPDSAFDLIQAALARRLREVTDQDPAYVTLQTLWQQTTSEDVQKLLVSLLKETATPASLDILLAWSKEPTTNWLKAEILGSISNIGKYQWEERFHPELSPALEMEWFNSNSIQDSEWLLGIATGIASIGTPEGIDLLLQTIANEPEFPKGQWARLALEELRNPEAIPVLRDWLKLDAQNLENNTAFLASGEALASMGDVQATMVLLQWVQTAPDTAVPLAQNWFELIRDPNSLRAAQETVKSNWPFASQKMRDMLEAVTKKLEEDATPKTLNGGE